MEEIVAVELVERINKHLSHQPWCDFEVMEYRGTRLVVMGSVDISASHILEVWFEGVFFVSLPMEWKTNTSKAPLSLVTGEEAVEINRRFRVEHGYHIFRFTPEDYPDDFGCLIGAREIGLALMPPGQSGHSGHGGPEGSS